MNENEISIHNINVSPSQRNDRNNIYIINEWDKNIRLMHKQQSPDTHCIRAYLRSIVYNLRQD